MRVGKRQTLLATLITAVLSSSPQAEADQRGIARVEHETLAARGFDAARSAGLFVGVRHFDDDRFVEVPFAADDAVDLAHTFTFGLGLVEPRNVFLALEDDPRKPDSGERLEQLLAAGAQRGSARRTQIYRSLRRLAAATGEGGLFVVTMATHGFHDPKVGDFLLASDSDDTARTAVSVVELFSDVARARALRRLVLLDACRERLYSSRAAQPSRSSAMSPSMTDAIARSVGQVILSSTTVGGYAYDDVERGNGVFTGAVLDGLRGGAAADSLGYVTVRTLADFVSRQVRDWVDAHRPEHEDVNHGISRLVEGVMADMPLAVHPEAMRRVEAYLARRDQALTKLRAHLHPKRISGALYDEITAVLEPGTPAPGTPRPHGRDRIPGQ